MGRPRKDESKLDLNPLQRQFVDTYFEQNESPTRIARAMGWPDRGRVSTMKKSEKVRIAIARRKGQIEQFIMENDGFNISYEERLKLLWMIAREGTQRAPDRFGNQVMASPTAAVAAIREINRMIGDNGPQQLDVVTEPDTRTEEQIRQSIRQLVKECQQAGLLDE